MLTSNPFCSQALIFTNYLCRLYCQPQHAWSPESIRAMACTRAGTSMDNSNCAWACVPRCSANHREWEQTVLLFLRYGRAVCSSFCLSGCARFILNLTSTTALGWSWFSPSRASFWSELRYSCSRRRDYLLAIILSASGLKRLSPGLFGWFVLFSTISIRDGLGLEASRWIPLCCNSKSLVDLSHTLVLYLQMLILLQSPAIIASLWYGSRTYSKYGSNAGAESPDEGAGPDEETPLLRESPGDAWSEAMRRKVIRTRCLKRARMKDDGQVPAITYDGIL